MRCCLSDLASLIFVGDLDAARSEARAIIREMLEKETLDGVPTLDRHLAIIDLDGAIVFSMPFIEALH